MSVHEDGRFDGAIVGCSWKDGTLVYSVNKCVRLIMKMERLDYDESLKHLESVYFLPSDSDDSPIFLYDIDR